jgi:hypothetical protein
MGGKITLPVVTAGKPAMLRCTTYGMGCAKLQDYCLPTYSRSPELVEEPFFLHEMGRKDLCFDNPGSSPGTNG